MTDQTPDLAETKQALHDAEEELAKLRTRLVVLQGQVGVGAVTAQRDDVNFARALADGADIDELRTATVLQKPALTQSELRRAISGTESLIANAQQRVADCKAAHRRARVAAIKQMLAEEQRAFDSAGVELAQRWCRVRAIASQLEQFTGVPQLPHTWVNLRIPRAVEQRPLSPFEDTSMAFAGEGLLSDGRRLNGATNAIRQELAQRGVDL